MKSHVQLHLLHNPSAGDQDNTKKALVSLIESAGFSCKYSSLKKKGWKRFKDDTALLVIAGGDGTVRQVTKELLKRRLLDRRLPVIVLPMGTANNFAKTLSLSPEPLDLLLRMDQLPLKKIDVGVVRNLPKATFFLEGMGFGLFPKLINVMEKSTLPTVETAEQELDVAFEKLIRVAQEYKAKYAKLTIDGQHHEGSFLLIEVLNIKSIGPNLVLAPTADPADGKLHVALLREEMRQDFLTYLRNQQQQPAKVSSAIPWELVEVSNEVIIQSENRLIHVDDELITIKKKQRLQVEIRKGVLDIIG